MNRIDKLSAGEWMPENKMEHTERINPNLIYSKPERYLVLHTNSLMLMLVLLAVQTIEIVETRLLNLLKSY